VVIAAAHLDPGAPARPWPWAAAPGAARGAASMGLLGFAGVNAGPRTSGADSGNVLVNHISPLILLALPGRGQRGGGTREGERGGGAVPRAQ